MIHRIPVCSETTCIDDGDENKWHAQSVERNSTIVVDFQWFKCFVHQDTESFVCGRCVTVTKELSDIVAQQEEGIEERLRRSVTACENIVKSLENKLIDSKSRKGKSNSLRINQTAEFELLLDSKLNHFKGKLSSCSRKSWGNWKPADKMKFKFCWNRQQKPQKINRNKKERRHGYKKEIKNSSPKTSSSTELEMKLRNSIALITNRSHAIYVFFTLLIKREQHVLCTWDETEHSE